MGAAVTEWLPRVAQHVRASSSLRWKVSGTCQLSQARPAGIPQEENVAFQTGRHLPRLCPKPPRVVRAATCHASGHSCSVLLASAVA